MSRDGNGTYSLPAGNPVVTGTTISSTVQNNTMTDVAAALTASIANDGQTTPTADLKMGGFKHKNVANATSRISTNANYASAADVQDGTITFLTGTAGTNTITASAPLGLAAYATGQRFAFIPAATNGGATTLNINSIGAKSVFCNGAACAGSELLISQPVEVIYDGTQFHIIANATFATVAFVAATVTTALPKHSYISGLIQSNGPVDLVNDIQITAGDAMDSTNTANMLLAAALIKQLDVNWAVGTNQGGLDTGAIANADYYIWLIKRVDTGVVDALFSLSSTAPTMPTNYTLKRLVGWIKRLAGTIVAFHAYETEGGGLEINWDLPIDSVNVTNTLTTSRRTDAMRVPLNFSVIANLSVDAADNTAQYYIRVMCPDETDAAIIANNANMSGASGTEQNMQLQVRTSAAGLVASRSSLATVDAFIIRTTGFTWARRN